MKTIKKLWLNYHMWINRLTFWEKAMLVLALLILGSIWLIYVNPLPQPRTR